MATVFDNLLSSDTYAIADAVNALKSQYVDEDDQTLSMGIYGYIGALETEEYLLFYYCIFLRYYCGCVHGDIGLIK